MLAFFGALTCAQAGKKDSYVFFFNRFGWIEMEVSGGKGHVEIVQGSKVDEELLFKSRLSRVEGKRFRTPDGVLFTLKKLNKPVINDGNRGINSGIWELVISGEADALKKLQGKIPQTAFGKVKKFIYYGDFRGE